MVNARQFPTVRPFNSSILLYSAKTYPLGAKTYLLHLLAVLTATLTMNSSILPVILYYLATAYSCHTLVNVLDVKRDTIPQSMDARECLSIAIDMILRGGVWPVNSVTFGSSMGVALTPFANSQERIVVTVADNIINGLKHNKDVWLMTLVASSIQWLLALNVVGSTIHLKISVCLFLEIVRKWLGMERVSNAVLTFISSFRGALTLIGLLIVVWSIMVILKCLSVFSVNLGLW